MLLFCWSVTEHPRVDIQELYYCSEIRRQHTHILQIPEPLILTAHVINSTSCGIYSTILASHPSTILRRRCLPSVTEICGWSNGSELR